jgi:hypothetical protein
MPLLDLPPELFQAIAHELVEVAGLSGAWQLRGVCRTFAAEIAHDILTKRLIIEFNGSSNRRLLEECIDRYLVARLRNPLDTDRRILKKLGKLVRWASRKLGVISEQEIDAVTHKICEFLKASAGCELADAIYCKSQGCSVPWYPWCYSKMDSHDKLSAALAIGTYDVIETRLPELQKCQRPPASWSWFEFAPLRAGLDRGSAILIKQGVKLLMHMASRRGCLSSDEISYLYKSQCLEDVVTETIRRYKHESFCDVLDLYENHLPRPQQSTFDSWFMSAVKRIDNDDISTQQFIKTLLNSKPRGGWMVTHTTLGAVAVQGDAELIKTVVRLRRKGINTATFHDPPILVAVRSRSPLAVDAIVSAGANVNISIKRGNLRGSKKRQTPLNEAIQNLDRHVVKCLLSHGAGPIPHVWTWPLRRDFYPWLRGLLWKVEGLEVPTFNQIRRLSRSECRALEY